MPQRCCRDHAPDPPVVPLVSRNAPWFFPSNLSSLVCSRIYKYHTKWLLLEANIWHFMLNKFPAIKKMLVIQEYLRHTNMTNIYCALTVHMLWQHVWLEHMITSVLTSSLWIHLVLFLFILLSLPILQMRRLKFRRLEQLAEGTLLVHPQLGFELRFSVGKACS